jgi:hypothetical protein
MFLAAIELAGRVCGGDAALTVAHPVGHGWPAGLVRVVAESLAGAVEGEGWAPDEVLIDGCCVQRDGAGFVRELERVSAARSRTGYAIEPVAWSELKIDVGAHIAAAKLFRVREG